MALEAKIAPMLSEHSDNIYLNADLYKRVAALHDQEEAGTLKLTTEQHYLLDKYYKGFIRSGAGLDAAKQERLRAINKELSTLTIEFGNHVLAENNAYKLIVDKKEDLAGLPESAIAIAADEAKAEGLEGNGCSLFRNQAVCLFCNMRRTVRCVRISIRLIPAWAIMEMPMITRKS